MAIYFDMAICTGQSEKNALHIKAHFSTMECLMLDYCDLEKCDENGNWWINLVPKGFGYGIPGDPGPIINSPGHRLVIIKSIYHRLQQISKFEFAVMGWEAADFIHELDDRIIEIGGIKINADFLDAPGTVLLKEHWEQLEEPPDFTPFSATHVWSGNLKSLAATD